MPARPKQPRARTRTVARVPRAPSQRDARVAAVRAFNRLYTRMVGALDEGHLSSPFTLTEVRVLFELAQRESATATMLIAELGLDAGYMSRLVRRLERRRLVKRTPSTRDARESHLALTAAGRAAFSALDRHASDEVARLLSPLDEAAQSRLVESMETIATLLGATPRRTPGAEPAFILRPPRAGDLGWVVQRHGELYAREYGWNERFEALVARVVADYVTNFDASRERCWIAERGGVNVGSVFVMRDAERPGVAKLRLLIVEPSARGLGIGQATRRGVHPVRARRGIPHDLALDEQRAPVGAQHLRRRGLQARARGGARQLWRAAHRRDVGDAVAITVT